jgi:heptosyltransferase-2
MIGEHAVSLSDFFIDFITKKEPELPSSFIALQLSAGNNRITYKNWPVRYWIEFLHAFRKEFPEKNIVLLGDNNETGLAAEITRELKNNIMSFAGKTNIAQAMNILSQCNFFIGLDGGLMHLAVALQKPTFTIWGPSSETLYGYQQFDPKQHQCVRLKLSCYPCSAWIEANHTKAASPETCPDHACMQQFNPQEVFARFKKYVHSLSHAG